MDSCIIDWQALATLATGGMAVCAALWVGKKQTEIQRRQTQLAENDLKIQLLDRRFECMEGIRQFRSAFMSPTIDGPRLSNQQSDDIRSTIRLAEFIFSASTVENIRKALHLIEQADHFRRKANTAQISNNTLAHQSALDQELACEQSLFDALPPLVDELVRAARIDLP